MKDLYSILLLLIVVFFASCSTEKNTAMTRFYHKTTTKYNIYYNGNTAYAEGLEQIQNACTDDYSTVLNLYPVSDHKAAETSKSKMERTIEKCRKCIKLHSIKKRPQADPKKRHDPVYRAWLEQGEFNEALPEAWMLLGKAEFHKGDFVESVGTFNYIQKHFDWNKDILAQCQIWSARAYAEIDWTYEAMQLIDNVRADDLSRKHATLYSAARADLMLKNGQYAAAIPHIKLAMPDEKKKGNRPRFAYVLGQLYELQRQPAMAIQYYKQVIQMMPSMEMDFNARIRIAELQGTDASVRGLQKMAKLAKNKDRLDLIYATIGNIYLHRADTTQAIQYYMKAAQESTQGGMPKAVALIQAGDLHFDAHRYADAQPCYADASTILRNTHPDYPRVLKRGNVLSELVTQINTVTLQDSLQHLSSLSEEEQMTIVLRIIDELKEAEAKAEEEARQAERALQNGDGDVKSVNTQGMIGGGGSAEWYFYNQNLLRQGKQEFTKRWGNRPLEDNWRRLVKTASASFLEEQKESEDEDGEQVLSGDSIPADSLGGVSKDALSTDPHEPGFYLQQIPRTAEDFAISDSLIAGALVQMVSIYDAGLENREMADATIAELERRFPADKRLSQLAYNQYLSALRTNDTVAAEQYRQGILERYPDSEYARIASDRQYFAKLRHSLMEQDSAYEATYAAYRIADFPAVKAGKQQAEERYPMSPLMPKFLLLNTIAVAKTENQESFVASLQDLVARYPDSEAGMMCKSMLTLLNEGEKAQQGSNVDNLLDKRQEALEEKLDSLPIAPNYDRVRLTLTETSKMAKTVSQLGTLLYDVALFNFSQFLIKDFDIRTVENAVEVSGFDTPEEREWYIQLLMENLNTEIVYEINR